MRRSFLVSFPLSTTFLFSAASFPSSSHSYNCYPNIIFPVTTEPQYLLPAHLRYYPVSFLLISFRLLQGSSYTQCLPFLTCLSYQLPANCRQPPLIPLYPCQHKHQPNDIHLAKPNDYFLVLIFLGLLCCSVHSWFLFLSNSMPLTFLS